MNKTKINSIITNLFSFCIQLCISLFVTPIIMHKVGTDAFGFIGLANDFIIYLSLVTTVLNSVSGRFIAVALYKNEVKKANEYFNSVLFVNLILSFIFIVIGIIFIPNIQHFLDVPSNLVNDVKLTFLFTLLTYILNIMISIYTTATFVKDRLDIQGVRNILQYALRGICVVSLFVFLPPRIYLLSIATLIVAVFISVFDVSVFRRFMPEVSINVKKFKIYAVKELAASGGLLAITNLSSVLLSGLDLLIANLLLGSYNMGLLSASKTLPNNLSSAVIVVASLFTPTFISLYSQNKMKLLKEEIFSSMKMIAFVLFVPLAGFMIFSQDFYFLWLNQKSAKEIMLITVLSNITVIEAFFNGISFPLAQLSLVTNKMRLPVMVSLGVGMSNTIIVLVLLEFTDLGVFAIASVSTILLVIRYLFFNPWYAAHVLHMDIKIFYKASYKIYCCLPVLFICIALLKKVFVINSWFSLGLAALVCGSAGYLLMYILLYAKNK